MVATVKVIVVVLMGEFCGGIVVAPAVSGLILAASRTKTVYRIRVLSVCPPRKEKKGIPGALALLRSAVQYYSKNPKVYTLLAHTARPVNLPCYHIEL